MVQFINLPESTQGRLGREMGTAFGQGLGKVGERIGQQQQAGILSRVLSGQATPEETAQLDPGVQLEIAKIQGKPPPGGLSGQPVPPEISQAIPRILQSNPDASADELAVQFDEIGIPRAYSNSYIENRRRQDEIKATRSEKRFESERTYQSQRALPYMKKLDEQRSSLAEKDQALSLMRNAIESGNLEFFSKDSFANFLGKFGEGLRTAKGAQLINAQKEFLLGNIARAGARPNMYIEQQISKMLPQIGRSDEANYTVVESFQAQQDLEKKKQETSDQLINKYESELGYVPGNIASQVDEAIKPYAQEVQSRLSYRLRNIQENEMGASKLKATLSNRVSQGTPLTLQTAQLLFEKEGSKEAGMKKAKELGYYIPSLEEYRRYTQ
jgi:hypothetical protein